MTTTFAGFHQWKQAPPEVAFLRTPHRHLFHVRAEWEVGHDDRDKEFFICKRRLDAEIAATVGDATVEWSCERWAVHLIDRLGLVKCEVSEDGENGAVVEV
ncbi:MAG TPA: hypothetical protein VIP46_02650 [Pyrinomonadaceae bacterium]